MNVLISRGFQTWAVWLLLFHSPVISGEEHHTLRYLYPDSRTAEKLSALAISDDSQEVAIAVNSGLIHFVRIRDGETLGKVAASPFTMCYSRDNSRMIAVGRDATYVVDLSTRQKVSVDSRDVPGYVGLRAIQRNGKLVIDELIAGGPAALHGDIVVGDEITEYAESSDRDWQSALGMTGGEFSQAIRGPVRSQIRLRVLHRGETEPQIVTLERQAAKLGNTTMQFQTWTPPSIDDNLIHFGRGNRQVFALAKDGTTVGSYEPHKIRSYGQHDFAPNRSWFASLSHLKADSHSYGIEIVDLTRMELVKFVSFSGNGFQALKFGRDGNELYAASTRRVDVINAESGEFVRCYRLDGTVGDSADDNLPKRNPSFSDVNEEDGDEGGDATSVADAAADNIGANLIDAVDARIDTIAVSAKYLAVASMNGDVSLWSIENGALVTTYKLSRVESDRYRERTIEALQFSANGEWLVYYIDGVLHIVQVPQ